MSKDDNITGNVDAVLFVSLRIGSELLVSHYKVVEYGLTKFGESIECFGLQPRATLLH